MNDIESRTDSDCIVVTKKSTISIIITIEIILLIIVELIDSVNRNININISG
jgi:hypothetical protein